MMGGNKKGVFVFFLITTLLLAPIVFASDVAYLYRKEGRIDDNIVDHFENLGLTVDFIQEDDLRRTSLSSYKLIFVGDERFLHPESVPVGDYPSIIVNYRHGELWGLTDGDGISSQAGIRPLEVNKNGQIIQVYTQAFFRQGNSLAIPYYYLSFLNKDPDLIGVVQAYNGGESMGDVIAYSDPGNVLMNGHLSNEKICFYGITESTFWTSAASDMFDQCIDFVASACSSDNDCGTLVVGNNYCSGNDVVRDETGQFCENPGGFNSACVADVNTVIVESCEDTCVAGACVNFVCETDSDCDDEDDHTEDSCDNPGTLQSACVNEPIVCLNNLECGTDSFVGANYCLEENVVRDFKSFMCSEAGSTESSCSSQMAPSLIEECEFGCANGVCLPDPRECIVNSDCGSATNDLVCEGDDVVKVTTTPICTQSNECSESTTNTTIESCEFGCSNGACNSPPIICTKDSDCNDGNARTFDQCISPGTPESYCVNTEVECIKDSDCGVDGFLDNSFCSQNSVHRFFQEASCDNPGTLQSSCDVDITDLTLQDCNDHNPNTADSCVQQTSAVCLHSPIGECTSDSQCGSTTVEITCIEDSVVRVTTSPSCTIDNLCTQVVNQVLINDCEFGCSNGSCLPEVEVDCTINSDCGNPTQLTICRGDILTNRVVTPICTESNSCSSATNEIPIQQCQFGCLNGSCLPEPPECTQDSQCNDNNELTIDSCVDNDCVHTEIECVSDSQCGSSSSRLICQGIDVYRVSTSSICSEDNECSSETNREFLQRCELGCLNGACIPDNRQCLTNSDCNDGNRLTQDICNSRNRCEFIPLACTLNSDCGVTSESLMCQGNDIYNRVISPICTPTNSCSTNANNLFVRNCEFGCTNGVCLPDPRECIVDNDCESGEFCN